MGQRTDTEHRLDVGPGRNVKPAIGEAHKTQSWLDRMRRRRRQVSSIGANELDQPKSILKVGKPLLDGYVGAAESLATPQNAPMAKLSAIRAPINAHHDRCAREQAH